MIVYEAPEHVPNPVTLFLGGGITACPLWQPEVIDRLSHMDELTIFNPRREDFPIDDPDAAEEQIKWEHDMLRRADMISFWFPCETLCPITLYELGYWTAQAEWGMTKVVVGVHPEYARKQDVIIQTQLASTFDIPVEEGFDNFVGRVEDEILVMQNDASS